ncbi:hypothetical protein Q5384_23580, partial (plasmid) [Enterobacter ludwigii]|uniref:hypothetical protein n=1 Tax=Enterobacter ludwigii TaxID=299767 RepID=UPI002B4C19EA
SLTQILRMQQITVDAGKSLAIYPQGRNDVTPMQLYTQNSGSLTPPDGPVGYYRIIANGANRTQPAKSRLNITVKKAYISQMARTVATVTRRNVPVISQSKITAYDYVGKVAESAVIYLNTRGESQARTIKE